VVAVLEQQASVVVQAVQEVQEVQEVQVIAALVLAWAWAAARSRRALAAPVA